MGVPHRARRYQPRGFPFSSPRRRSCTCVACCCTGAALLCCRCGLVGTYCCTAVVLLWSVGRWVGGGWWVLGGWRLARSLPEMSGGRKNNEPPRNEMLLAYRYTAVHTAALLYCCSGLIGGWCMGGGCTGWCLAAWWIVSYVGEFFRAVEGESPLEVRPHTLILIQSTLISI